MVKRGDVSWVNLDPTMGTEIKKQVPREKVVYTVTGIRGIRPRLESNFQENNISFVFAPEISTSSNS